jgi:hypothetical protein
VTAQKYELGCSEAIVTPPYKPMRSVIWQDTREFSYVNNRLTYLPKLQKLQRSQT